MIVAEIGPNYLSDLKLSNSYAVSESKITLMHGYQNCPTLPENIHMSYMGELKKLFGLSVGYQDHCDANTEFAFWLPAASVGMGVEIIEKHITHDRSKKGVDHESALNPDEFIRFVEMVRILEKAKGNPSQGPFLMRK